MIDIEHDLLIQKQPRFLRSASARSTISRARSRRRLVADAAHQRDTPELSICRQPDAARSALATRPGSWLQACPDADAEDGNRGDLSVAQHLQARAGAPHLSVPAAIFGHLTSYSSNYYTYAFDKVIALDFFDQFDPTDLLGCDAGSRYRKLVLEQDGSKPGRQMVRDFLSRDEEYSAFSNSLNEEFEGELIDA